MHIAQKKIPRFSAKWCGLQLLNVICWCISIVAAIGSIDGVIGKDPYCAPCVPARLLFMPRHSTCSKPLDTQLYCITYIPFSRSFPAKPGVHHTLEALLLALQSTRKDLLHSRRQPELQARSCPPDISHPAAS